jgi:GAF domain-containing protein
LCGWVVRHGRPRRADDVTHEEEYLQQYTEMRSELDVPIKVGETVTGVLNVESPERAAFNDEDEALLQVLACFVALGAPG